MYPHFLHRPIQFEATEIKKLEAAPRKNSSVRQRRKCTASATHTFSSVPRWQRAPFLFSKSRYRSTFATKWIFCASRTTIRDAFDCCSSPSKINLDPIDSNCGGHARESPRPPSTRNYSWDVEIRVADRRSWPRFFSRLKKKGSIPFRVQAMSLVRFHASIDWYYLLVERGSEISVCYLHRVSQVDRKMDRVS